MILACLRILGNSPVKKDKLIRFVSGFKRSFLMIVGILSGLMALWTVRVLISALTSSGDIGERKKDVSDCLFEVLEYIPSHM